jgi:hypothetical protein
MHFLVVLLMTATLATAFVFRHAPTTKSHLIHTHGLKHNRLEPLKGKKIIVEISTTRLPQQQQQQQQSSSAAVDVVGAYESMYDDGEEKVTFTTKLLNSPASKILNLALNPISFVFAVYAVVFFGARVRNAYNAVLVFVGLKKKEDVEIQTNRFQKAKAGLKLPFEIWECEKCKIQVTAC